MTKQCIEEALGKLPDHPGAIALYLDLRGIQGERGDSDNCPLARFILEETGLDVSVSARDLNYGYDVFYLNDAQEQFVYFFDNGKFPCLEGEYDDH